MENLRSARWIHISLVCVFLVLKTKCLEDVCPNDHYPVSITFVESAVSKGAVCLDGSPPAYYFDKGFSGGISNWLIYFEGGGWCQNVRACYDRVHKSNLGSSINMTKNLYFQGMLSKTQISNPDFFSWNKVYVGYCDGSSFTGDVEAIDPATNLHYRGGRVFSAVIEDLLQKGMINATNAILTGTSAGGLATILHCDGFRAMVPNAKRVKCISDAGYFIHSKHLPGLKKREDRFAEVVSLHGSDKFLPSSCTSKRNPGLCLFPEYLVNNIQTPLFLVNSLFDQWQIKENLDPRPGDELGWKNCTNDLNLCSSSQLETIKDFGMDFVESLPELGNTLSRGMFINSCYSHGQNSIFTRKCSRFPTLSNKTIAEAIGDWYFERSPFQVIDTVPDVPRNCTDNYTRWN
ncbi:Pectin acetylesterase 8 [Abeliophyllum distichum]|uniref:Pectin acetylesterase n=1 Tax=Abeliophyllum distichum TaxID=126358 RepID=A0ABD1TY75_9LAMI